MVNTGKYKQYFTIPEAAMFWEGLPFGMLSGAAYSSPGVPVIVGYPDVTPKAEALIEATDFGTLMECGRVDPDMRMPAPPNRIVNRYALLEWIQKYWPDELPGKRKFTMHEQPPMRALEPEDRFLTSREAWEMLGIEKATFYRRRKLNAEEGGIPAPNATQPNRWRLSIIQALVRGEKSANTDAGQAAEDEDEDI